MENSIKAVQVRETHIAHILLYGRYGWDAVDERAASKQIGIKSNYFMPGRQQPWYQYRSDVAFVPRH